MIFHPGIKAISMYVDNNLDSISKINIEKHLSKCEKCRKQAEFLKPAQNPEKIPMEKLEAVSNKIMEMLPDNKFTSVAPIIGEIENILGFATVADKSGNHTIDAFPGMAVKKGDKLITEKGCCVLIKLNDGSSLYINKETSLDFETPRANISLVIGEIFAMMKPQKTTFSIQTPSALIGVIGTEFNTKVTNENKTILQVIKGSVLFSNEAGSSVVRKKKYVEAAVNTKPIPKNFNDYKSISGWTGSINTNKEKGGFIMKKILYIIGSILILCLVAIVGFWIYDEYFTVSPYTPIQTQPVQSTTSVSPAVNQPAQIQESSLNKQEKPAVSDSLQTISRPPFNVGEKSVSQIEQIAKSVIQIPGQSVPMVSNEIVKQKISVLVREKLPNDIAVIELVFLSMTMDQEANGMKISANSDLAAPQDARTKAIWNIVKALTGNKIDYYITKDYNIQKIDGINNIIEKIKATCPPEIVQAIKMNLDEESMKSSFESFGNILPEYPVKVGDEWKKHSSMNMPLQGKTKVEIKYRFVKWIEEKGTKYALIEMNGNISSKGEDPKSSIGAKVSIKDGKYNGALYYNPENGSILKSTLNINLDMEILQRIRDKKGYREEKMQAKQTVITNTSLISAEMVKQ